MKYWVRMRISRLWATCLLVGIVAISSFVASSSQVFAATCNPSLPLDASGGSASCDMTIAAQVNSGVFTLAADSSATVTGSPFTLSGTDIVAAFRFSGTVRDHRGNTNGARLMAASAGISNGTVIFPLNITSVASLSCTNGTCPPVSFTLITPLTTTPQAFFSGGNTAHTLIVDGDYTATINGQFTIPTGSPSGVYTGIMTATLMNTF